MESEVKQEAYATRLSLPDALRRVREYERAFGQKYEAVSAIEFTLIGVDTIEDLDEKSLDVARVLLIEKLITDPADF